MSRVKRGPSPRRRHKRVLATVEGFFGGRKNRYRQAMRVLWKSWQYAYAGRKLRKRESDCQIRKRGDEYPIEHGDRTTG